MTRTLPKGIRQRGGAFVVDVTERGVRKHATAHTLQEAMDLRATLRAELCAGKPRGWSLEQAREETLRSVWKGLPSESHCAYNSQCAVDFLGAETQLTDITGDDIAAFVTYLKGKGNANATINRKLAALSRICRLAVQRGHLEHKPYMHHQRESEGRIRWLTEKEEDAHVGLYRQWSRHDHADAFIVLIDTGMRTGELWKLTARDCDFDWEGCGAIRIWDAKNGESRSVPMTARVKEILRRRTLTMEQPFPYGSGWIRSMWERTKTTLGLQTDEQYVPHVLRHTCASRLIQNGVPAEVVQKWLGHKSLRVTMRYAHLAPTSLLVGIQALARKT